MSTTYAIPFEYLCSEGHAIGANNQILQCPAYVRGCPCDGELHRIGKGSRRPRGLRRQCVPREGTEQGGTNK